MDFILSFQIPELHVESAVTVYLVFDILKYYSGNLPPKILKIQMFQLLAQKFKETFLESYEAELHDFDKLSHYDP